MRPQGRTLRPMGWLINGTHSLLATGVPLVCANRPEQTQKMERRIESMSLLCFIRAGIPQLPRAASDGITGLINPGKKPDAVRFQKRLPIELSPASRRRRHRAHPLLKRGDSLARLFLETLILRFLWERRKLTAKQTKRSKVRASVGKNEIRIVL